MRSRRLAVFVCLLVLCAPLRSRGQEGIVASARAQALGGHRPEAIARLRAYLATEADDDARVLLGTLLSWEGEYADARHQLAAVLEHRPTHSDALNALINVELWSDHPREAKALADRGLSAAPNNGQFLESRRRAVAAIDGLRPWQMSTSYSYDWFNEDRTGWQEAQASLSRATPVGSLILRGSRAARFGVTDNQFEVEMYPRIRSGTYAYVGAAFAPDRQLYPEYRYAADVYQSLGGGFEASIGFRRLGFSSITDIYVGALTKYVGSWLFTGKTYYVPDPSGASSQSYHASFRRYFGGDGTSYIGLRYGHGFAREEVLSIHDLEAVNSDMVAGEMSATIHRRLDVGVSGGTSRQERVNRGPSRQTSVSARVGLRF